MDFPGSVVEMFPGDLGQPYGGFPKELQKIILKGKKPLTVRPGELLEPVDFDALKEELFHKLGREVTIFDVVAYALYPKVFIDYEKVVGGLWKCICLDTPTFFYG